MYIHPLWDDRFLHTRLALYVWQLPQDPARSLNSTTERFVLSMCGLRSSPFSTLPLWEKVQSRLRRQIGKQAWNILLRLTLQVTDSITKGESL